MESTLQTPDTMRALVLTSAEEPPSVKMVPTPKSTAGTAVVRILAGVTINFMRAVYAGGSKFPFPKPMIPGSSAIGRVATVVAGSTKVKQGDLVFFDCVIRSRDNPVDVYLSAVPFALTDGQKILRDEFGNGAFAEYCRAPLENLFVFNEARLTGSPVDGGLGYKIDQLAFVALLLVPFGGLKAIDLRPGQTIIIAPATGPFGGYAVLCAQAMGARVVAMGRNETTLADLEARVSYPERLETVRITDDFENDLAELRKIGQIDAFLDIGPPAAYASTHVKSSILALRHGGRVSLMAGYSEDVAIPYKWIMTRDIHMYGKYMYERDDVTDLFKLIENDLLDLNIGKITGAYALEQWKAAWDQAVENTGFAKLSLIKP